MGGKNYFMYVYIIFFRKGKARDRHIAQFRSLGP
jgi:hypothetical protein